MAKCFTINWEDVFEYTPIESQKKYQEEYYSAIANCDPNGNSTEFIEFMLKMIDGALKGYAKIEDKFADEFLTKDGESAEDAKNEQMIRENKVKEEK